MTSIVIAAHNEAAVIGRCLDALLAGASAGEFDITVVANGCMDDTAGVARARDGVRVLDLPAAGKAAALNAGEEVAAGFPRIYLDADIVLGCADVRLLRDALQEQASGAPLAVVPRRELDLGHASLPVRGYYAINARLPVYRNALFGRGCVALSAAGRARFARFPGLVADDLFLDSLFTAAEKRELAAVAARIATPRRTRDLVRRLVRVRRGNARMRAALGAHARRGAGEGAGEGGPGRAPARDGEARQAVHGTATVRAAARSSWLRDVALREPALLPAALCYAAITVTAAVLARMPERHGTSWGRDESSRREDLRPLQHSTGGLEVTDADTADGRD